MSKKANVEGGQGLAAATADAMQVDSAVSPQDPTFLDSLAPDLREIADAVLAAATTTREDVALRLEMLEVQLRKLVLQRIRESRSDLGDCWKSALHLCLHFVFMSEAESFQQERYKELNARKIPFILLEDIFDCVSVDQCRSFWEEYVLGSYETLFGQRIWSPSPTQHPCWLTFLKVTNKLIRRLPPKDSASIMLTLCRVYPLAERSGTRGWGSHNAENVTLFEHADEFEKEQSSHTPVGVKTDEEGSVSDYSFYESFWKLQEDLNHPNVVDVASFLQRLKTLITALENHAVSAQKTKIDCGIKYLTSSQLISYQLGDPEFRIHILTQILIVCHHLSSAGPLFRTKLVDWQNRSKTLLKNVGSDGVKHLSLFESIMDRSEEAWRGWKKDKCQEDLDERRSQPLTSRKRRRTLGGALGAAFEEDEASQALTQGVLNATELSAASKKMRGVLPSMDTHLAEYIEALDPEAGIEAEYHPKNNKLFAWRALRVMSRDHLGYMQRVHVNGDFEGLVRHIYKEEKDMDIPGDIPDYIVEDFEEKEREEEEMEAVKPEVEDTKPEAQSTEDEPMEGIGDDGAVETETPSEGVQEALEVSTNADFKEAAPATNGVAQMDMDHQEEAEENDVSSQPTPDEATRAETTATPEPTKPEQDEKPAESQRKEIPVASIEERPRLKFTPPPGKGKPPEILLDRSHTAENGHTTKADDSSDINSGGRRARGGGPGRGDSRSRGGASERGRNQPTRSDRGPGRDDRRALSDRRSRSPARDDRGAPTSGNRGDRGPPPVKGSDRVSPPRRDDRGPPPSRRNEDHWAPASGRGSGGGHGRDDHRRGGGGRGGGGGHRGDDRGPPPERWDDQQRRPTRRDDRGDDRRDGDDRRGPRRRHR